MQLLALGGTFHDKALVECTLITQHAESVPASTNDQKYTNASAVQHVEGVESMNPV
jgi:hypothetical protein